MIVSFRKEIKSSLMPLELCIVTDIKYKRPTNSQNYNLDNSLWSLRAGEAQTTCVDPESFVKRGPTLPIICGPLPPSESTHEPGCKLEWYKIASNKLSNSTFK